MLLYTSTRYYVHQGIHVICVPREPPSTYQGTRVHVICMCTHVVPRIPPKVATVLAFHVLVSVAQRPQHSVWHNSNSNCFKVHSSSTSMLALSYIACCCWWCTDSVLSVAILLFVQLSEICFNFCLFTILRLAVLVGMYFPNPLMTCSSSLLGRLWFVLPPSALCVATPPCPPILDPPTPTPTPTPTPGT